jgi:hypothetical protein
MLGDKSVKTLETVNPGRCLSLIAKSVVAAILGFASILSAHAGGPQDWSNRYLIYSNPDTPQEADHKGTVDQWKRDSRDHRFVLQLARKQASLLAANAAHGNPRKPRIESTVHRDWSNVMGGAAGVGRAGVFPAKFGDVNSADCANDFVVFTTASSGATSSGTFATRAGTFSGAGGNNQTVRITNSTNSLTLTLTSSTTASRNTGTFFYVGTTAATSALNLAAAIARNGGMVGVTASASGTGLTVTATTTGTGANTIGLQDGLANFAWAGTTLAGGSGTAGQPTIIAFNQLYSSCAGTPVPATFWSYNTGAGAVAVTETSPVISLDGAQVAFMQRIGSVASLVLLKWSNTVSLGTTGAPSAPTNVAASAYRACSAPCMTVMTLSGSPNNTNSSPFYRYFDDVLYVGASDGTLHRFTGIFDGTPAESGGSWPVTVSLGNALSSPVYDFGSGLVFVGSAFNGSTGGQLHSVDAAGTLNSSGRLSGAIGSATTGVADAPMVDSTAQKVYAFVASDTSTSCNGGGTKCQAIYQFSTASAISGLTSPKVQVGRGDVATRILYGGVFDDTYYSSASSTSPSGGLYVCGSVGANSTTPTLWNIPIANNVMGAAVPGPTLVSGNAVNCSPITEVKNGTADYLYVSVSGKGNDTGCTGACIYLYNLTGLTWGTAAQASAGLPAPGGTGGIVVDNISPTPGASQIYYSTLTSPGNAIQASQAGLN